jgi:hypothetical protein
VVEVVGVTRDEEAVAVAAANEEDETDLPPLSAFSRRGDFWIFTS